MKRRSRGFWGVKDSFILKTFCASLLCMLVLTGRAEAAPTGISGYVRSFDGTPLNDVTIQVFGISPGATDFKYWWTGVWGIGGYYEFNDLLPGTYKVLADPYGSPHEAYMPTWYMNEQFMYNADIVTVTTDQVTPNIDISLRMYGSITGRVTEEATGDPIAGISVNASNTTGNQYGILNRPTNADGQYTLYMRTGSYRIHVNTDGTPYKDEYYDNVEDQGSATLIDITEGDNVSGGDTVSDIDFALALHTGGSISGRVLDPDGNPVPFAGVNANAIVYCNDCYGSAQANAQGYYTIDKLPATDYRVRASVGGYPDQHYYKQVGENSANPVTVTLGQDTPNIDFRLLRGGKITGQVRHPNSDPVEGMYMSASAINGGGWGNAYTESNGDYEINTLAPGEYRVHANPVDGQNDADKIYKVQYYSNQENEEDADPVIVVDEQTMSGINFDLVVGGTISGQLTNVGGSAISNRRINAWPADGDGNYYAYTDGSGNYTIQGLPYGDYIAAPEVKTYQPAEQDYMRIYYNEKARYNADVITLSAGSPDATGINFQMVIGGKITGQVSPASADAYVVVLSSAGERVEEDSTNSSGNYEIKGLPGGTFKVLAMPDGTNYAFEYYNNTSNWGSASNVNVTLGNTTSGINFSLAIGGKISGQVVRDEDGQTMADIQVDVDDGVNEVREDVGYANTDSDGNYEIRGLPAGSYKVKIENYHDEYDFVGEYYNGQPDWSNADVVTVSGTATTTDIDFSLALTTPKQTPRIISPVYRTAASLPVFAWTAVISGTSYDLLVDDLTNGTPGVIDASGITGTTFTPSSSLTPNHEYEVKVRAVNGAGQGPWSPVTLFTQLPPIVYNLTVTVDPAPSGSVTLDPPGGSYDAGTEVTLTAAANAGWMFQTWSGDVVNPASPSTTITVDEDPEEVTVTFLADTDSDGIADSADNCPNDANGDQADSDGDGLGNVCDTCPNDPDNDADSDGVCGDLDACPNDPTKTTDVDSDGDGMADCADSDDDNDGLPDTFEAIYDWLDPLDPSDALEDQDNDGHSNVKEYLAGSDPDDWLSTPQIQIADWYVAVSYTHLTLPTN